MKKVRVYYKDDSDVRVKEWDCGPYYPEEAKEVAKQLAHMGCRDFRFEPVHQKEAA